MKIVKVLNNNSVLADEDGIEYILFGGGIGFNQKKGQEIEPSKIERRFIATSDSSIEKYGQLIESIPEEYVTLANTIIEQARGQLKYALSNTIYVSLTDHLYNLVRLYKDGMKLGNPLSWEIKKFYPLEYQVGLSAISLISQTFDLDVEESEAGNIAMHLINAQINDQSSSMMDVQGVTKKIRDIMALIRMHNGIEIDETSLAFDRFVTHLRFFFKRVNAIKDFDQSNPLLEDVVKRYPKAYETTKLVGEYLQAVLNDDEQLYLTLHIQKLIEK
ncbi:PRD domain-containing protein [Streptococcus moroccensis]|uniref:Beta-glucoside operon transcriptional antiterminator n=1 Tax=Streptococcus moroccensis TaxID=1451356 RepID=A0ABT9YQ54_9STRE|nr:PRD domain-containing protein [Streptococcus moroccensis]MDQ0222116.1 beta-glucoside operon transcriptional antiterminator [Streptococcus moroccensis]